VWCLYGATGLAEYRDLRKKATSRLSSLNRTAYTGCFHDGREVLSVVRDMHVRVRMERGQYDHVIVDVVSIVDDMLGDVDQRPDAYTARRRFQFALQTAQRMSFVYPAPFQDSSDPLTSPHSSPTQPAFNSGLGVTFSSSQETQANGCVSNRTPYSSELSWSPSPNNRCHSLSIHSRIGTDLTPFSPSSLRRINTGQETYTPLERSSTLTSTSRDLPVNGMDSITAQLNTLSTNSPIGQEFLDIGTVAFDKEITPHPKIGAQTDSAEHHQDRTRQDPWVSMAQVRQWIHVKKLNSQPPPESPISTAKLSPLTERDQVSNAHITTIFIC
jgi:hypothetical protein